MSKEKVKRKEVTIVTIVASAEKLAVRQADANVFRASSACGFGMTCFNSLYDKIETNGHPISFYKTSQ